MNITSTDAPPGVRIVTLEGRLNASSADAVHDAVRAAAEAGRPRVVLDLGGVDFMDSSGLGAIVRALKAARAAGGDLRIARASWQSMLVFQLTNMDRVLTFADDPATAFGED